MIHHHDVVEGNISLHNQTAIDLVVEEAHKHVERVQVKNEVRLYFILFGDVPTWRKDV